MPRIDTAVIRARLKQLEEVTDSDPRGHILASLKDLRNVYVQLLSLVEVVNQLETSTTTALIIASSLRTTSVAVPVTNTF